MLRKAVAIAAGLAVLAFVNYGIWQRERLLSEGEVVLLRLAPVDPRSLMQGDYMRLEFEAADQAFGSRTGEPLRDGRLVVALDQRRVGQFRRVADGRPLAPNEIALRFRIRDGRPRLATNAFFFEEGQAESYERAAFGEFRVGADGETILTGLRDAQLRRLGPAD
ncbi:GDYXXLXY domain-containing protein [Sphingosinicella terrae]|uniref:GDYXXLXY domain-containing protein n=1 Tax=Sphingosinicella terrae TaxID=2172047 RepID=UPI000E0D09D9|nr:GDYXXLXY domain-containing protein [Sphingosinicella terrae]